MPRPESQRTLAVSDVSLNADRPQTTNEETAAQDQEKGKASPDSISDNDPNAVGWDGADDPHNPMNWPERRKWINIGALSLMTLLTPLGSSMFAPGVPDIMVEFKSANVNLATFLVSVYVLGFAFGPLIAAPLSEIYGRALIFNIGNVLFVIFTVATALSQNMGMMIAFRFLMGFVGSTPITNGSGTISDMFPIEQRGKAMAVWAMGPLLGPCIGPVAGGFMIQDVGWRWVFWVIAIAAGILTVVCYFVVTESYHPTLLQWKTNRMKKETGNKDLYSVLDVKQISTKTKFEHAIVRPMKMLFTHPPVFAISLYIAVVYGVLYLMFSTFTFVFAQQYGFGTGIIGLSYIPTGVGMLMGTVTFGIITDIIIKKKLATGEATTPEDRVPIWLTVPCGLTIVVSLFWYGWAAESNTHWIVPMIGVAFFCFGLMGIMMCLQVYLIDVYVQYAASVIAAVTVLRSLLGALLPLAGLSMYNSLGLGWGNSILAFLSLVLVPVPVIFRFYGAKIRAKSPDNLG
ncbi:major facilitator superfamily domain-containing protein [Dactylonectria estremocensis]|uniref:Major facilitator superfamily domain-containing protein n=1 Tax=Dactylonectria estremocensis TaxID=1079267 RepID=A0A9P9J068_9HYPO|nr:major facilitator superfamily domain-containing protein [Dactylonectria estremocensis]